MTKATEGLFEDELQVGLLTLDSGREAERPKSLLKNPAASAKMAQLPS